MQILGLLVINFDAVVVEVMKYLLQIGSGHTVIHSMARANLNKSKKVLTSTTSASKYIPKRPRICIN